LAKACKIQAKVAGEKLGVWFATVAALHEAARPDRHLFLEAKSYVLLTRVTPRARIPRQNILQARERAPQSLYGQLAEGCPVNLSDIAQEIAISNREATVSATAE
jgi:hypothetical protein